MCKYILLLCFLFFASSAIAQTDSLSKEDNRLLDSMFKNDAFINMMKKDKNYLDISLGIGNGEFSAHNNAANATGVDKQLVYTPGITYRLKNGLSFGVSAFITGDSSGKAEIYQTGLTAGYDYYGSTIYAGGSYTRYLSNQDKYNSKSIYQNDLSAYVKLAKGLFQPGIMLGYVDGKYKEMNYVTFKRTIHLPNPPPNGRDTIITINGKDSTDNKTSYFSVAATVGHDFYFYNVLSKKDELDFIPTLMLNMGSDKLSQTHTNRIFDRPAFSNRKKSDYSNKFQLQSIAASLDLTYMIKKFFIQPVLYLDYYLPETTENRFSAIFSINTGFSF
ncbi:MAG: hypothetical protein ACKOU7_05700 [Ferruginibacter sp.]